MATKADIEQLRADIDHLRVDLKADMSHLRTDIKAEMRGEFNTQLRSIYTVMIATMLGTASLSGTLAFAAAKLA